jgi:CRP-like cAMP-binding protein
MMAVMKKIEALKKTEMFGRLTDKELNSVAETCVEHRLKKGEILFTAGEESRGLYVIASGSLRAFRANEEGREQIIHVEKMGTTIAEVPVFDDKPYPSTAMAEETSEVLFISKTDIKKLCLKYPAIALSALKLLAERLRKTAALVESLSLREVDQRLAAFLIAEFKEKKTKKITVPSYVILASRLGSVREVVSRSFAKLEQAGLISTDGKHEVSLLDAQGLADYTGK